ncbi:MAG TPA: hypothetical protein VLS89_11160 [Candidatus Nanopelagicales bacterium]|nr:hypothetical protein [Candidatus Nanopelagicales bacterium]
MRELVPINVFAFMPFDAGSLEKIERYDGPGIFLVVEDGPSKAWAYVGVADDSLKDRLRALLLEPGELRDVIARGVSFAPVIIRNPASRDAAARFLVHELRPALGRSTRPPSEEHECVLKFYGPEEQHPPYTPGASGSAKVQAA